MRDLFSTALGKAVRHAAKLRGGGGSALPGLVVEKVDPGYLARVLGRLPLGVVAVSGTNGKTTTTKMIVEMCEALGLRVFTNRTGSNFSRGVAAAAVQEASLTGKLAADIAVLELDEAHAMYFIDRVQPDYTLLLNVLRDQLDRFGEIDTTAQLLQRIADATTRGLIVNAEDPLVARIGERSRARQHHAPEEEPLDVRAFGLSPELRSLFPSDDDFHGAAVSQPVAAGDTPDVLLTEVGDHQARFVMDGESFSTPLQLEGLYNTFNATAALATVRAIIDRGGVAGASGHGTDAANRQLVAALSRVKPAFGRGEKLVLDGRPLELVLVKNPAGFRLALASFDPAGVDTMIAINDQYADGRDMSWLWDVDFTSLAAEGVTTVSGTRAWDMTLRLEHDRVAVDETVPDLSAALRSFRDRSGGAAGDDAETARPRRIYCTYTAMLELRRALAELTDVEDIW